MLWLILRFFETIFDGFLVEEIVECFGGLVDRAAGASTCP